MALSDSIEVRGVEFIFTDGKVNPVAHVVVVRVVKDGDAIIARNKHRYNVSVDTGDCSHMTNPAVSDADRAKIAAQCATAKEQYGIWASA